MSVLNRKSPDRPLDADQQRALSHTLERRPGRAFDAGLVVGAAIVLLVAIVVTQNDGKSATLDVLWWTWSTRLWLVIAVSMLVGAVVGLSLPRAVRRRRALAKERASARKTLGL
jgi:uncharacterized integral membrane protein